jgi:hypothetical protein
MQVPILVEKPQPENTRHRKTKGHSNQSFTSCITFTIILSDNSAILEGNLDNTQQSVLFTQQALATSEHSVQMLISHVSLAPFFTHYECCTHVTLNHSLT